MAEDTRSPGERIADVVYGALQRFAALSLVAFGFVGPAVLGMLGLIMLPAIDQVVSPSEITAEYMVSMSLSPFPDPDVEILDTTEKLMEPPSGPETPDETDPEVSEGTERPFDEPVDPKADPVPVPEAGDGGKSAKPTEVPPGNKEVKGTDPDGVVAKGGTGKGGVVGPADQEGGKGKAQQCLPENPDIKHIEGNKYRVKRELVDFYVNHINEAGKLAYLVWVDDEDGKHTGFRIRRIRCGNDLHQLGFRNKDIVRTINGQEVQSTREAVAAYMKMRNTKVLKVKIERRGKERTLIFRLVD
jgi:hypothetical protein